MRPVHHATMPKKACTPCKLPYFLVCDVHLEPVHSVWFLYTMQYRIYQNDMMFGSTATINHSFCLIQLAYFEYTKRNSSRSYYFYCLLVQACAHTRAPARERARAYLVYLKNASDNRQKTPTVLSVCSNRKFLNMALRIAWRTVTTHCVQVQTTHGVTKIGLSCMVYSSNPAWRDKNPVHHAPFGSFSTDIDGKASQLAL